MPAVPAYPSVVLYPAPIVGMGWKRSHNISKAWRRWRADEKAVRRRLVGETDRKIKNWSLPTEDALDTRWAKWGRENVASEGTVGGRGGGT